MKSRTEIRQLIVTYLDDLGRTYADLAEAADFQLEEQFRIEWGARQGEVDDLYFASYQLPFGGQSQTIFVAASATTGEVLYSRGPHGILEQRELPEDPEIESQKEFITSVFGSLFAEADFSFGEASQTLILYESYDYNLEFQFDTRYGKMVYGGMYIRLLESNNAYRLNEMVEHFDSSGRTFKEITEPHKGIVDLRVHEAVIRSHLLPLLKSPDISWEPGLRAFVKQKFPW